MSLLQEELFKHAWIKPIVSVNDKLETETSSMNSHTAIPRFYRKTQKPFRQRDWKTRKDPFDHVKDFIELELQKAPSINAKEILDKLMEKYPGDFYKGHLRTLQRRISDMRNQDTHREKKYQELMVNKKTMTVTSLDAIISISV